FWSSLKSLSASSALSSARLDLARYTSAKSPTAVWAAALESGNRAREAEYRAPWYSATPSDRAFNAISTCLEYELLNGSRISGRRAPSDRIPHTEEED